MITLDANKGLDYHSQWLSSPTPQSTVLKVNVEVLGFESNLRTSTISLLEVKDFQVFVDLKRHFAELTSSNEDGGFSTFLRTLLPPLQLPVAQQHAHPPNVHKCCG